MRKCAWQAAEITRAPALQTTFIYVDHDQIEAMTLATRIASYKAVCAADTPKNLYGHPNNLFVAGFIGSLL